MTTLYNMVVDAVTPSFHYIPRVYVICVGGYTTLIDDVDEVVHQPVTVE